MKNVQIRAIGKPHASWQSEAIRESVTRLKPFMSLEIIEVSEGHSGSAKPNVDKTREIETTSLLKSIPDGAFVVALDVGGKQLSSEDFSTQLETWSEGGRPVVFLIGGSWGFTDELRTRANAVISFGAMTLPHILCRIVLLEQLYRSEMITRGKGYHK